MASSIPHYAARISKSAQRRSKAWTLLADLWAADLAGEVRSGEFAALMRNYFRECGQEALAIGPLMSLDVYARGSRRRDADADLEAFTADRVAFESLVPLDLMRDMARLCRTESAKWAAGDIDGGRMVRRQEFDLLDGSLEGHLVEACKTIASDATTHVWKSLAKLVLVYVSTETGRQD